MDQARDGDEQPHSVMAAGEGAQMGAPVADDLDRLVVARGKERRMGAAQR